MNSNRPPPPPLTRGELAKEYLSLYNAISAIMWLSIFGRVVLLLPLTGPASVYEGAGDFTKWTQTAAVLEIVHSALGLVRAPLLPTLVQVASRLAVVWGVVGAFPDATAAAQGPWYSSMLLAWSATEVVRYGYFVLHLRGAVPGFLAWLRYNMFYVFYPVGITSEVVLVWRAGQAAREGWLRGVFWGVLGLYVPGE
ncbi:MAG: hypothetical protein LQ342_002959 [Letrouitia transgressa]|nr:MAG: hypothetical protein LQ342_002959 [Letrouitia transgressa]